MKRILAILLCAVMVVSSLAAEEPQIAFRLLDDYVAKEQEHAEKSRISGGVFGIVAGAVLMGASATAWFYGDEIYSCATKGESLNPNLKLGITIGLAASGGLCVWGGVDRLSRPVKDMKSRYSDVYEESDPDVQEAMAAATIQDIAMKGRARRVGSVIGNLTVSVLSIAINVGGNVASGRGWSDDLGDVLLWQAGSIGAAISTIFIKSDEERLYDKYLAARETLYSSSSYRKDPDGGAAKKETRNAATEDSGTDGSEEED